MAFDMSIIYMFVAGLIGVAAITYVLAMFNGLIRLKNNIKKAWANIDVLLKQRSDELPKLLESVKGYMKYEKGTLTELTKARTEFLSAKTIHEKAEADNKISGALKSIFAVAENYPNLKASDTFIQLQNRISGLENELSDRREFYNDSVNTYNIRIEMIPDRIVAGMLKYGPEEMFKVGAEDKKDVEIKF